VSVTRDRPATKEKPEAPKATQAKREYVVLVAVGEKAFERVGIGVGKDDFDAIRDATKSMSAADRSRPFVAVARSRFKVRSRKIAMVEQESWD